MSNSEGVELRFGLLPEVGSHILFSFLSDGELLSSLYIKCNEELLLMSLDKDDYYKRVQVYT